MSETLLNEEAKIEYHTDTEIVKSKSYRDEKTGFDVVETHNQQGNLISKAESKDGVLRKETGYDISDGSVSSGTDYDDQGRKIRQFDKQFQHASAYSYHPNGQVWTVQVQDGIKNEQIHEEYSETGKKLKHEQKRNNIKHGHQILHDGTSHEHYDMGQPSGVWSNYDHNGKLKSEEEYLPDNKTLTKMYLNNVVTEITPKQHGKVHGTVKFFDQTGNQTFEGEYVQGVQTYSKRIDPATKQVTEESINSGDQREIFSYKDGNLSGVKIEKSGVVDNKQTSNAQSRLGTIQQGDAIKEGLRNGVAALFGNNLPGVLKPRSSEQLAENQKSELHKRMGR